MLKKNQSNLYFIMRKRNKKYYKSANCFDIVLAKKRNHNYFFIIEKLGAVDFKSGTAHINFFRLAF